MTDRLFDPQIERAISTGSLFDRDELGQLRDLADQATSQDRAALAAMTRKEGK